MAPEREQQVALYARVSAAETNPNLDRQVIWFRPAPQRAITYNFLG
jgi:predicted site-specific integrase-resolvase